MPADSHDREFPIAKWVAALEVALRSGDWNAATAAAAELRRLGVVVTIPGLGTEIRPAKGEEGSRPNA